ncbi:MAG TPA: sigma 54-interacting transcriptional regulator [Bacteroidota bacterium]|nr:sigma 54-interacting transcriptional regulator [Bacteroidota bacterium]
MENPQDRATEEKKNGGTADYPIVGKSKAVEQLIKQIAKLAKNRRDIVIIGEAGTGKGAVAKNIFIQGKTSDALQPFMSINLSVIDDRELEAVLFGFDRGVEGLPYTSKRGLFEQANGGTVLIEELEEASFRNQMKILSFINERKTRRIGGDANEQVDIRLIITLKDDPASLVERRKLLEELYGKIMEFERVDVQPLRERPEDIPLLVKHFATDISRELGIGDVAIDVNAIDVLIHQPWKENIRELKAVVDKCVLFSHDGRFILPPELVDEKTEVVKMINNIMAGQEFVLDKSLDVIEKGIIERSLEKFGFNQSKAAQFLGMTEQTFRYKLKRLGIASARSRA